MSIGDDPTESVDHIVESVRARVAAAPIADDIEDLADRAITQIRALADEAVRKARQLDALMQRLAELREQRGDDGRP